MGLHGSPALVEVAGQGIGLGAAPQEVVVPLDPPEDKLRLPNEDERVEANSSGELRGEDMAAKTETVTVKLNVPQSGTKNAR